MSEPKHVELEDNEPRSSARSMRGRIDAWCEWGILGLVLGVVLFAPVALGGVRPTEFLVLQFLTVGILALWLVRFWFGKTQVLLWAPICWAVLPFVGYAIYRYRTAEIEFVARQELIQILIYTALFFAILNNLHGKFSTRVVVMSLITLATVLSLYAVYQWITNSPKVWFFDKPRCYFGRASGSYICPNHFAGFLEMLLPLTIAYTLTGRFKPVTRVMLAYAALAITAGIAVTLSRGAYAAGGLALMVCFICILRQRSSRVLALVCLGLIIAGVALFHAKSIRTQDRLGDTQVTGYERDLRLRIWPAAMAMWQDHFWTGVGPGHFDYRYRSYRDAHDKLQARAGYAHNDYLNTLADYGLIGLVLVLLPLGALYWGVFWGWNFFRRKSNDLEQKKSNKAAFVLGAATGLFAILLHSILDFNLHIPANAILAVTLMALITGHLRFATDRFWVSQRLMGRLLATVILGAGITFLAWQGGRRATEQWWLQQANRADNAIAQRAALTKAFACEPMNSETAYTLAESLRLESWQGRKDWKKVGESALPWYQAAFGLNPYDPFNFSRYGMCLDWLKREAEAGQWFERAIKLDPHNNIIRAEMGWHYLQLEDYEKAQEWFHKSRGLNWTHNQVANSYLKIIEEKLAEKKAAQKK